MGGDASTIKERLDIAEVIGQHVKLEKAGSSLKGRCPFHNEKTASFFVSQARQSYYCFGCGMKGDIFTFVQAIDGLDFKSALKQLAEKAGVELEYTRPEVKTEKDKLYAALEDATLFFESNLEKSSSTKDYLKSRGVNDDSIKNWRLGYAPDEWRLLSEHLMTLGYTKEILLKAGLIKRNEEKLDREPYDIFRGRVIFPLSDPQGRVIAFSGRALGDVEPKYLNSPDTPLFTKSEVLYGLDKAKEDIRKKNYTILVEGQMDLVLSHQVGVKNTVASSGTAFTNAHLERLKRLSPRIILAFDGDEAGKKAAERSAILALVLGLEVKEALLPEGKDPADLSRENSEEWKNVLRDSKHAIEITLDEILKSEKDARKIGKLVEKKILPMVALLESSIEQSHFVSHIGRRTGIKEDVVWNDLKKVKKPTVTTIERKEEIEEGESDKFTSMRERIDERLKEIELWQKELPVNSPEHEVFLKESKELEERLNLAKLEEEISSLKTAFASGQESEEIAKKIEELNRERDVERRKLL
jgi:DNA primase